MRRVGLACVIVGTILGAGCAEAPKPTYAFLGDPAGAARLGDIPDRHRWLNWTDDGHDRTGGSFRSSQSQGSFRYGGVQETIDEWARTVSAHVFEHTQELPAADPEDEDPTTITTRLYVDARTLRVLGTQKEQPLHRSFHRPNLFAGFDDLRQAAALVFLLTRSGPADLANATVDAAGSSWTFSVASSTILPDRDCVTYRLTIEPPPSRPGNLSACVPPGAKDPLAVAYENETAYGLLRIRSTPTLVRGAVPEPAPMPPFTPVPWETVRGANTEARLPPLGAEATAASEPRRLAQAVVDSPGFLHYATSKTNVYASSLAWYYREQLLFAAGLVPTPSDDPEWRARMTLTDGATTYTAEPGVFVVGDHRLYNNARPASTAARSPPLPSFDRLPGNLVPLSQIEDAYGRLVTLRDQPQAAVPTRQWFPLGRQVALSSDPFQHSLWVLSDPCLVVTSTFPVAPSTGYYVVVSAVNGQLLSYGRTLHERGACHFQAP